jgi:predicted ATPase with chaperone activity
VARPVSTVLSRAPAGLAAPLVRVEVHLGAGLPALALVGLPEASWVAGPLAYAEKDPPPDLAEVRGQFSAKRALEIAAAGAHGLLMPLMIGPLFRV